MFNVKKEMRPTLPGQFDLPEMFDDFGFLGPMPGHIAFGTVHRAFVPIGRLCRYCRGFGSRSCI